MEKVTAAADAFPELVEADVLAAFEIFDQNGNGFMPLQVGTPCSRLFLRVV